MEKYIYAFDLSMECTGLVIFNQQYTPVLILSIPTNKKHAHGQRLKVIADKLIELKERYKPCVVTIERGFSCFNISTQVNYRVHGLVNYLFAECEQIYYPPKKVKEAILNGNATKKQVQEAILKKYPDISFENEDQSDAFAVGLTYFILNNKINFKEEKGKKK